MRAKSDQPKSGKSRHPVLVPAGVFLISADSGNAKKRGEHMNFSDNNFLSVGLRRIFKIRHGYIGGGPPKESKQETKKD